MRYLVDECFFRQIVEGLSEKGHDVVWARTVNPGETDEFLLAKSVDEDRIVVTEDRDFGELTVRFKKRQWA